MVAGCMGSHVDPRVSEPIRHRVEPELGGDYLLYRPSSYSRDAAWPLVIVCHGGFPDSPNRRIRDWARVAELRGFLVVAPSLTSARPPWPADENRQLDNQRVDERNILATIRHIRAGHNISDDRIFIHGSAGGAYAALHTGLKNPGVFRAVAVTQPKFDESYLADALTSPDRHEPVYIRFDLGDAITGKQGARCGRALRAHGVNVTEDRHGGTQNDTDRAVTFFERTVRESPWIHIAAFPLSGGDPMEVRFALRTSHTPAECRWTFGDGGKSSEVRPVHRYGAEGDYTVTVTLHTPRGDEHKRTKTISVP